jgi:hypothetical protein
MSVNYLSIRCLLQLQVKDEILNLHNNTYNVAVREVLKSFLDAYFDILEFIFLRA